MSMEQERASEERYVIEVTRFLHDDKRVRTLAMAPSGKAVVFSDWEKAQEHIDDYLEAGTPFCNSGEWRLPSYDVREVSTLPQFLQWQV